MKKKLGLFLKISISVLLVYLMIKFANLDLVETFNTLKQSNWKWFVLCTLSLVATIFTNTYRWRILANLLGYNLSFVEASKMYFEAFFANNFLPSNFGGDAWRSYDLGRRDKGWLRAASTVLAERIFGFTMMFALMPIAILALKFSPFAGSIPQKLEMLLWISFTGMILAYLTYPLWSRINLGFIQKIKFAVKEYTACKKSIWTVVLWTFITHVFLMLANIFAALATSVSFDQVPFWFWFIVVPTSTLLSFVIPGVKGVSAKEASYIYLLGFIGVGSHEALAIAFLVFLGTLISSLPGVSIAFRKSKDNSQHHEEMEEN